MYCSGGLEEKHKKYSDNDIGRSHREEVACCVKTKYRLVGVCGRFGETCCLHLVAAPWSCRQQAGCSATLATIFQTTGRSVYSSSDLPYYRLINLLYRVCFVTDVSGNTRQCLGRWWQAKAKWRTAGRVRREACVLRTGHRAPGTGHRAANWELQKGLWNVRASTLLNIMVTKYTTWF